MGRILKLIAILVGAFVVLIAVASVLIVSLFDPNDYKQQIAGAVQQATGRKLTLEGNLSLKLWPHLRIAVGRAELGNAPGFGAAPFARIDAARLEVEILPLLARHLKIGEVSLDGLTLNLARDAAGKYNWADLGGTSKSAAAAKSPGAGDGLAIDASSLAVNRVSIKNANVNWSDATTNSHWSLKNFGLDAKGLGSGNVFPLSIDFALSGAGVTANVDAKTQAAVSLTSNEYRLQKGLVVIAGSGKSWPGGEGEARVSFDSLDASLDKQTVDLKNLGVKMLGVDVRGDLSGRQLLSSLSLSGAVDIMPFSPRDVLAHLNVPLKTADSKVMRRASASAKFDYDAAEDRMGLSNMKLRLDDSNLTGSVGLRGKALQFSLALDAIDIDRYLPPASAASSSADEGSLDAVNLPIGVLRSLTAAGDFKLGRAQFSGLKLSDAAFTLNAADGRARLRPSAKLYGGSIAGEVSIDVQDKSARFGLVQSLKNVDLAGFGHDYLQTDAISGTGDVNLDVSAVGTNIGQLKHDLDGKVSMTFKNGAWEGFDAWYEMRRARALLKGNSAPPREGKRRTPFSVVSATGTVTNAVLASKDLHAVLPFMSIDGAGTVNLLSEALSFKLKAKVLDTPAVKKTPDMEDLAGSDLPLTVGGTLESPSVKPDFTAVARERAKQKAEQNVEEKKKKLEQNLRDKLKGLLNR
jgi:AsmA protein